MKNDSKNQNLSPIGCLCKSYNAPQDYQTKEERVLVYPFTGKKVCIDDCIADTILFLWDKDIQTVGSCCGHNHDSPSLVLEQESAADNTIATVIQAIRDSGDLRDWDILSWTMTLQHWHCPRPDSREISFLHLGSYFPQRLREAAMLYDTP